MRYSKSYIMSLAKDTDFIGYNLEKVLRLGDTLDFVFSDERLCKKLVLKGGTAINLCYLDLKRLSVDIDFDYVGSIEADLAKKERIEIVDVIKRHMAAEQYELSSESRENYTLTSLAFFYQNSFGNKDSIKIEINFLNRVHLFPMSFIDVVLFEKKHSFFTVSKEEIYGSKIAALLDRTKARDLFDVYQISKSSHAIFKDNLRKSLVFYLAMDDIFEYSPNLFKNIDSLKYKEVRSGLKPVLSKTDPFDLNLVKNEVKSFLNSISLSSDEQKFLICAKNRIFDFSLIFTDEALIERMNNHPMVIWKKTRRI